MYKVSLSHAGIPGDGRCLFRSVAYGACLRSGEPAASQSLQRELADDLRAKVMSLRSISSYLFIFVGTHTHSHIVITCGVCYPTK